MRLRRRPKYYRWRKRMLKPPLTIANILCWVDAHRQATGKWPTLWSGEIAAARYETWLAVNHALKDGLRGLPGGSSLARLLAEQRGARNRYSRLLLTADLVLGWADAYRRRTGRWPTADSGPIPGSGGETWQAIEQALRKGTRGCRGASSLAQLLAAHRGMRNPQQLPALTKKQIVGWADAHQHSTGAWPTSQSGPVAAAPGETWSGVNAALAAGLRGLRGGYSLARLLADRRGKRNRLNPPDLKRAAILAWADAFHERTGQWPTPRSGAVAESPDDTWYQINQALKRGQRGLRGGCSLAQLLVSERGVRRRIRPSRLTLNQVLAWADAHFERTGRWPTQQSGAIDAADDETWAAMDIALRRGFRGLPGDTSLARVLTRYRGKKNPRDQQPLTSARILAWADAHFARTGAWPTRHSGPVHDAPGEDWRLIDGALCKGLRGLAGGSSLLRLLVAQRQVRDPVHLPPLNDAQILAWADRHHQQTGHWPKYKDGPVLDAPGETWAALDAALRLGMRGLARGASLAKLLGRAGKKEPGRRGNQW